MAFGIDDAIAAGLKILDKFIPDPELREQAAHEMRENFLQLKLAQIDLNKAETQNGSLLGKWRGALGWGLALSAIYQLILVHFVVFIALFIDSAFPVDKLPKLDWQELGKLLMGMLGL